MARKAEVRDTRDRPITRRMRRAMDLAEQQDKAPKLSFTVLDSLKINGERWQSGAEIDIDEKTAEPLVGLKIIELAKKVVRKAQVTAKD